MIDGISLKLGDRELTMPRLTVGALKRHWPAFAALRARVQTADADDMAMLLPELVEAQAAIIHAALRRNYPDLPLDEVQDGIELGAVGRIFSELIVFSRLEAKPADGAAGEAARQQS